MDPALLTAATGMMAQQTRTDVIANNLANINTTGFKRSRADFEDLLYQTVQNGAVIGSPDAETALPIQIGRGTRLAGVQPLQTQGNPEQTGRNLDVAIEGAGYFQVQLPSGDTAYTRDGSFNVSDQGTIVTQDGYAVMPNIKVPQDATGITISSTGEVTATRGSSNTTIDLGRIELATFANPSGLLNDGQNLLSPTPSSGDPVAGYPGENGMGQLLQGSLEGSNVQVVQEMVDMITAMRAYEINSKAITNADQMQQMADNLIR
ncbi:MAG TPA: flagellar basal-body rod protein FlgG [Gemmatimonadaceae bacterium]|nr:flagellar basal-body rod protein FlgG [Gemmatimonadaceae bacterium]